MKLSVYTSVNIDRGKIAISWSESLPNDKGYRCLFSFEDSGTAGGLGASAKGVEYACAQLAATINAALEIDRKLTKDPAEAPKMLLNGSDLEMFVANKHIAT